MTSRSKEFYKDKCSCGSHPRNHDVQNFNAMWGDGDVVCTKCKKFVRFFDSG